MICPLITLVEERVVVIPFIEIKPARIERWIFARDSKGLDVSANTTSKRRPCCISLITNSIKVLSFIPLSLEFFG